MKLNPEQYQHLKQCVDKAYKDYQLPSPKPEGITATAYTWIIYHQACKADGYNLYHYFGREINDNHIQTAMTKLLTERHAI
jgi:hypoxanthine phosphoribosyltransferase